MAQDRKGTRYRYWTFIVYPESAPENWKDILQQTGCPIAISPIHNMDKNPTGELKKEHYHILICFGSPTSFNVVNNLCEELNQPIPKRVLSVRGLYRYLTHKDNPDKYQYFESDIQCLNGFDEEDYLNLTTSERLTLFRFIFDICQKEGLFEYSDLIDYLRYNELNDLLNVVCTNTVLFNAYLKSKNFKMRSSAN